jgi:GntR family transcriptional regulator/MocR family aminotransferase
MFVVLDRNSGIPVRKQLYDAITLKILKKELSVGYKLPSTRELAEELGIARNTVVEIYEQLISEGYLETVHGSGTFVAGGNEGVLESAVFSVHHSGGKTGRAGTGRRIDFRTGVPDLGAFPRKAWLRAVRESLDEAGDNLLGYGPVLGYMPLRGALSEYLMKNKGIHCSPEQVVIVNGTSDAMSIIALLFQGSVKELMAESAVVSFVPDIFRTFGYRIRPLETDRQGLCTDDLPEAADSLIFCSPSHQFPLGGTLSVERRLQLANYAKTHRHYIIEDDYDSEFRYAGAPVNSIFQLAPENTIHLGTFSKTLAPFLRLGYMVVPVKLAAGIRELQSNLCRRVGMHTQMALHRLFEQNIYARHVMTMRKRYKRKMRCITNALHNEFGDSIRIFGENCGLHVAVAFSEPLFDAGNTRIFLKHGVSAELLTDYMLEKQEACDTLILGFGSLSEEVITEGVKRLKTAVSEISASR